MPYLETYRGDSLTFWVNFSQADGTPVNVSGWEANFAANYTYSSGPFILITGSGIGPESVTGSVSFSLSSGDTNQCAGNYPANARAISPSGSTITSLTYDTLRINPSVLP